MPILLIILAVVIVIGVLIGVADQRMRAMAHQEARTLLDSVPDTEPGTFRHSDLDGLPAPVQRFLKRSVPDGFPMIQTVRLKQIGGLSQDYGKRWFPFTADQYFTAEPPGFVWLARGWLLRPLVWMAARDKYMQGRGNMLIKPESIVTVADARGPQMDQGSLARYLAEIMWFPTALLPHENLHWEAVDDHNANVTLTDHETTFTATYTFDENDDIIRVEGLRYQEGHHEPVRWGGKVFAHRSFHGVRIPSEVEVYWNPPEGYQPYYRGTITELDYNVRELY